MGNDSRSVPGQGDPITIYLLVPADKPYAHPTRLPDIADPVAFGETEVTEFWGEDFATTTAPITIKVKDWVARGELVAHLRDFINVVSAEMERVGDPGPVCYIARPGPSPEETAGDPDVAFQAMHDLMVKDRCPRCHAVAEVFCFHRGPVTGPRTTRHECLACGHVAERTEAALTDGRP